MVARPRIDLLPDLRPVAGGGSDPTLPVETAPAPSAERELSAERTGEPVKWDEPDTYDDYTADWRSDYARDVGMPLREKIR